nr:4Fe-4S dicluster domain-containing protein [Desulfobacterales bacterium]
MARIMVVDHELCTGCRICEIVCSVKKEGASDPSRSRIHIVTWDMEGIYLPMLCQHCEEPLCAMVCPVNAIHRDKSLDRVIVDEELCVGCRGCVSICPLGGVGFDINERRVFRCDLCDGDPTCVKYCEAGAIQYIDIDQVQVSRWRTTARRLAAAV